jgi:hypothetical protein
MRCRSYSHCLAFALLASACPVPVDPVDSTTATGTDGASGTSVTPSAGASTGDTATGDTPTGEGSASGDATSSATTGSDGSTGDSGQDDGCAAYCAKLVECGDPQAAGCSDWCPAAGRGYGYIGDSCLGLFAAGNSCVAGLSCEQIANDPMACEAEEDAIISETCTTRLCRELCDKGVACGASDGVGLPCSNSCSLAAASSFSGSGKVCTDAIEAMIGCQLVLPCDKFDPLQGCEAESVAVETACN